MIAASFLAGLIILVMEYLGASLKAAELEEAKQMKEDLFEGNFFGDHVMTEEEFRTYSAWLLLAWCAWSLISMLISGSERSLFGVMGERLSYTLRTDLLRGIMYKQVSWFDREDRAPGILTNIMSENVTDLNGMTSETIVTVVEVLFSLTFGILGGFVLCWQQAAIAFVLSPIAIGGAYAGSRIYWGKKGGKTKSHGEKIEKDDYESSNALLSDVILNYRTVMSFGQANVDLINAKFKQLLEAPQARRVRNFGLAGLANGWSSCARVAYIGAAYMAGNYIAVEQLGLD